MTIVRFQRAVLTTYLLLLGLLVWAIIFCGLVTTWPYNLIIGVLLLALLTVEVSPSRWYR